jgi:hypothetical protein
VIKNKGYSNEENNDYLWPVEPGSPIAGDGDIKIILS